MIPRHLRFTRAIAFATLAAGCGARTPSLEDGSEAVPEVDAGRSDASADARPDSDRWDVPGKPGTCLGYAASKTSCAPGGACIWNDATGTADCRYDVIGAPACGDISCGRSCTCVDATAGVCRCEGPVEGPLPPPDLPNV
jgi:hypothetical protein